MPRDPLHDLSEEEARELTKEHPKLCRCPVCSALQLLDKPLP